MDSKRNLPYILIFSLHEIWWRVLCLKKSNMTLIVLYAVWGDLYGMKKLKHLFDLPNVSTHLSLWKGDIIEEGSFDAVVNGCSGVFHVATPMDFVSVVDSESQVINPIVNGALNLMRSCIKAKTVKRIVYTSTTGTVMVQREPRVDGDESFGPTLTFVGIKK